eukprot:SAG31_NODE_1388_length_8538_cov_3.310843_2_plen_212_part_00
MQRQQHLPPTAAILLQLLAACRIVTHGTAGGHDGGARRAAASATTADDKPLPAGWLLAPEANNLPRVGAAGDTHILGAFTSWGACVNALNAANATQGPFHSITWFAPADTNRHQPPKSSLEGGCFGVRGTEWRPRIHQVRDARIEIYSFCRGTIFPLKSGSDFRAVHVHPEGRAQCPRAWCGSRAVHRRSGLRAQREVHCWSLRLLPGLDW